MTKPTSEFYWQTRRKGGPSTPQQPCIGCVAEYSKSKPPLTKEQKERKAKGQRDRVAKLTAEQPDWNTRHTRAHRAGIRVDKCALCRAPIPGRGICDRCQAAVDVLGGTEESLKAAVRAVRWITKYNDLE